MGSAVGPGARIHRDGHALVQAVHAHAGHRQADAQHHRHPLPGRGGRCAAAPTRVSLINTINSIVVGRPRHAWPRRPTIDGKGTPWRLLRPGGEADRAQHGGRDRPRPGDARPADLGHRRHHDLARRGRVHRAGRRHGAGLHRRHDLRLPDRRGDDGRPVRTGWTRRATRTIEDFRGMRRAERHRLAVPQPQLRHQGASSTRTSASSAAAATSPARTPSHQAITDA